MPGSNDPKATRLDLSLDALGHPYRRRILTRILDHNPLDVTDFASGSDADSDRLLVELHHRHLPMLAEAGFVDWDREADVLRRGPRFDDVAPLIELLVAHSEELPAGWS